MQLPPKRLLWILVALVPMALVAVLYPLLIWILAAVLLAIGVTLHLVARMDRRRLARRLSSHSEVNRDLSADGAELLDPRYDDLAGALGSAGSLFLRVQRQDWDGVGKMLAELDLTSVEQVIVTLIVLGKLDAARRLTELARREMGVHGRLWFHQGVCAFFAKDLDTAIQCYRAASTADVPHRQALCYLAAAHIERGELDLAVEVAQEALSVLPQDRTSWTTAILVYAFRGDEEQAGVLLGKLPEAIKDLGPGLERMIHLDAGARRKWVHRFPLYADTAFSSAHGYLEQRQYALAEPLLERALALDPLHLGAAEDLGYVLSQLHRDEDACQLYDQVLQRFGGSLPLRFNRGNCLLRLGRLEEAAAEFERCIESRQDWLEPRINLFSTLATLDRLPEARAQLDQIEALGAPDTIVGKLKAQLPGS